MFWMDTAVLSPASHILGGRLCFHDPHTRLTISVVTPIRTTVYELTTYEISHILSTVDIGRQWIFAKFVGGDQERL
jgi:hypothetical protein